NPAVPYSTIDEFMPIVDTQFTSALVHVSLDAESEVGGKQINGFPASSILTSSILKSLLKSVVSTPLKRILVLADLYIERSTLSFNHAACVKLTVCTPIFQFVPS